MSLFEAVLPMGRIWDRVGSLFEITRKPRSVDLRGHETVPFVPMEAVPSGGPYEPRYEMKAAKEISSGTYFERGDLLVAKITPSFENGKQALVSGMATSFGIATTEVIPLRPRSPDTDPRLLFFYLLHPEVRSFVAERMEGSTGRQRVPESVLLELRFPRLPPDEQRDIANVLERVCRMVDVERQSEASAAMLKRVAMRDLFTRGLRGEAQKESEIGSVPESWDVSTLGAAREWLQYGTSTRCSSDPSTYPVLRIPNVEPAHVDCSDLKYCDLPNAEAAKYLLANGDLLFIRTNGVLERLGSCAVYTGEPEGALFASYLIRARLKPVVDPRYVAYFYGSAVGTSLVAGRATPASDGKYNLNTATIDSLPLPIPPTLEEQRDIVVILEAIDRKIDLHKRKRAVLDELFKSLLHKLMTGEIALSDLDLSALAEPRSGLDTEGRT